MALIQKSFSDIITFSRSSNATRVGPTGLVEYAPHNLLTYSEQFDNAAWNKVNATTTANAIAAPNGTVTAELIAASSTSCYAYQAATIGQPTITFSVYAKPGSTDFVAIETYDGTANVRFGFNLVTLATSQQVLVSATNVSASAVSVGNGWVRCSVTFTRTGTSNCTGFIYVSDSISNTSVTNGKYAFFWGAQLSVGPYALDYTPTTSAAVYGPRFDYDPVTLAARGLLVEEQRTNLLTYSDDFSNAAWDKGSGFTLTPNAIASPDGTINADLFVRGSTLSFAWLSQFFSGNANQALTFSCWVRTVSGSSSIALVISDVNLASVGSSSLSINTTWQRLSFSITAGQLSNTGVIGVGFTMSSGQSAYFWGAQLEAGSFATSYIPTLASTVTRSADVASVNTLSPWYNSSESTLFAEFDFIGATLGGGGIAQLTNNISNNGLLLYQNAASLNVSAYVDASSVLIGSNSVNVPAKVALAYNGSSNGAVRNGGAVSSVGTTVSAAATQFSLGSFYGGVYQFNGHLRRVASYPRRLTNAELQALTA